MNWDKVRNDFPILKLTPRGKTLIYLDSAATTQKPEQVIRAIKTYYEETNSNIHRGVHFLSEKATREYEAVRSLVKVFLNAGMEKEIVFTKGATEGVNLVATSFGERYVHAGDEILVTGMEHHSNIVPWQMLCERKKAHLKVVPITDAGELDLTEFAKLLSKKVKLLAVTQVSNALGTVNPLEQLIMMAHDFGIAVLVDGAQGAPHLNVDVQKLDCDFYVFSGHKIYAPTGIGVLYGKKRWLEEMPPYQGGGDMIEQVSFTKTTYNSLPYKFEAGTPNIEGVVGLGAALQYLDQIGMEEVEAHEKWLMDYAVKRMSDIPGVQLMGYPVERVGVVPFMVNGVHPHDVGTILDREGIAIRAGHHCAQPVMERFGVAATCRASFGLYNTHAEVDQLVHGIQKVREVFKL